MSLASFDIDMALSASLPPPASSDDFSSLSSLADIKEVSIRFTTRLGSLPPLPSSSFSVPVQLTRLGLSSVVNGLLQLQRPRPFDFLIDGRFLRTSLLRFLQQQQGAGVGVGEVGLLLEVVEALSAPQSSQSSAPHPDWIAAVHCASPHFAVTGCYDRHVRLVRPGRGRGAKAAQGADGDGDAVVGEGHLSAVKCVRAAHVGGSWKAVSGSKDRTVRVWDVHEEGEALRCAAVGRGHADGVEAVAWLEGTTRFISAGWDRQLLLWDVAQREDGDEREQAGPGPVRKALKSSAASSASSAAAASVSALSSASVVGSAGGCVTGVCSPFPTAVYAVSLDSSLRHFDLGSGTGAAGRVWWMGGGAALHAVDVSADGRGAAVGCWDGAVRLVDLRAPTDDARTLLSSHTNIVAAVSFSPVDGHRLASASYDGAVKVWDVRARVPLMTLRGQKDAGTEEAARLLALHWGTSKGHNDHGTIVSAGTDRRVHWHEWSPTEDPAV